MFTLSIQCASIDEAELYLATIKYGTGTEIAPSDIELDEPADEDAETTAARVALMTFQDRQGIFAPLAILGRFGAASLGELKRQDYPGFIAACEVAAVA